MEDPTALRDRRTFTPAIVASSIFTAACAVFAIAFVSARGGLQLPVAASQPPVAAASATASVDPIAVPTIEPGPSLLASSPPTALPTPPPTLPPPSLPPTLLPESSPTPPIVTPAPPTPFVPPTLEPGDPLLALGECEGHPGCFEYVVVRGDTLSGIISDYLLDIDILEALNPGRLSDPSLIVVGQLLYLGRDPLARLEPCPDGEACALYVVRAGETINQLAARYLLTREAILEANPGMPRPIEPGQVIRLPRL